MTALHDLTPGWTWLVCGHCGARFAVPAGFVGVGMVCRSCFRAITANVCDNDGNGTAACNDDAAPNVRRLYHGGR